jgi:two-component system chemotaxis response regulator CheB
MDLVAGLPQDFPAAMLVVTHIPAHTPSELYHILDRAGQLPALQAVDGEAIRRGHIYVASADRHLMVDGDEIRLTRGPKENRSRPSINVLFRSAAYSFGPRVTGIILTGMLDDGVAGLWTIKDRGGMALVQSPEEAEYPSMPQSAIEHVEVDAVLPIAAMPMILGKWVEEWVAPADEKPVSKTLKIEHGIELYNQGMPEGSMELGRPSLLTCPECHGAMMQIQEGSIIRFRCHTGHGYSLQTLLTEVDESIDASLWGAVRAIQERILLLHTLEREAKQSDEAAGYLEQTRRAEQYAEQLLQILSEPDKLEHNPSAVGDHN